MAAALVVIVIAVAAVARPRSEEPAQVHTGETVDSPTTEPPATGPVTTIGGRHPPGQRPARTPYVVVRTTEQRWEMGAYTYCYGGTCSDGSPFEPVPDLGSAPEVIVEFPSPGWEFSATLTAQGEECGRPYTTDLEEIGEGIYRLRPTGPAGRYRVSLAGYGQGDLFVAFGWTTPTDGPLPEPRATVALLADRDGTVDSYGVELTVAQLATTPTDARATITVTAANGRSLTFDATDRRGAEGCGVPEGSVAWAGPAVKGLEAAALGPRPFDYRVVLVLDGAAYVGDAVWPADVIPDESPAVRLHFEPPLPSFEG